MHDAVSCIVEAESCLQAHLCTSAKCHYVLYFRSYVSSVASRTFCLSGLVVVANSSGRVRSTMIVVIY